MKSLVVKLLTATALLFNVNFASATVIPVGIKTDTSFTSIVDDGWSVLYRENTGLTSSIADVFGSLSANDWIILGGVRNTDNLVLVHAAVKWGDFSTYTSLNVTNTYNGTAWYFNGNSMGFTAVGDAINQTTADTSAFVNGNLGLSIHTNYFSGSNGQVFSNTQNSNVAPTYFGSGYRFGNQTFGNDATGFDFVVFTEKSVSAVDAPASLILLISGMLMIGVRRFSVKKR
jgi:hypothetical protein